MIPVYGRDELVARWLYERFGLPYNPGTTAIGFTRNGTELHGAAVFSNWNGANVDLAIYGPGCLTRDSIRVVYHYAFRQIKATRITALTARNNKRMLRLLPRLGFKWEGVAKRYYGQAKKNDAICFALFPENTGKWLPL